MEGGKSFLLGGEACQETRPGSLDRDRIRSMWKFCSIGLNNIINIANSCSRQITISFLLVKSLVGRNGLKKKKKEGSFG